MGEMADMQIEQMLDEEMGCALYRMPTICRTCGSAAVVWRQVDGKWRLHDPKWMHPRRKTLKLHPCAPAHRAASVDEFEDVSSPELPQQNRKRPDHRA